MISRKGIIKIIKPNAPAVASSALTEPIIQKNKTVATMLLIRIIRFMAKV
jgi:hypothetical protein